MADQELVTSYVNRLRTLVHERDLIIETLASINLQIGHLKMEARTEHDIDIVEQYRSLKADQ